MIPKKLELRNFLSYRDLVEVDFSTLHLACISGLNGAGKSSLLDGITWVLFGQSRAGSDDDVVNRAAARSDETAEVRYTFELGAVQYRVIRRKRTGRSAKLDLQLLDEQDNWKSLTEGKLRETQAAIERLLNMNYDSFVHASFFLQGQADRFTTLPAGQRKQILAQLLGVDQWNQYRDIAADARRQAEGELGLLDGRLQEIEQELGEEDERLALLAATQAEVATLRETVTLHQGQYEAARQAKQAADQLQKQLRQQQEEEKKLQDRVAAKRAKLAQRETEQQQFQTILDLRETVEAAYQAWREADQSWHAWQQKANQYHQLQQEMRPFEVTIAAEKSRLTQLQSQLQAEQTAVTAMQQEKATMLIGAETATKRLAAVEAELVTLAETESTWQALDRQIQQEEQERRLLQQEFAQLQIQAEKVAGLGQERKGLSLQQEQTKRRLVELEKTLALLGGIREERSNAAGEVQSLEVTMHQAKEDMDLLKERIDRLQNDTGTECPLCGQPLTTEHRNTVLAEVEADGKKMGNAYREKKQRVKFLQDRLAEWDVELKRLPQQEKELRWMQQSLAGFEARIHEISRDTLIWSSEPQARYQTLLKIVSEQAELDQLRQERRGLQEKLTAKRPLEIERQQLQTTTAQHQARLDEIGRIVTVWEADGIAQLNAVTAQLTDAHFAVEARDALTALAADLAKVGYDETAHAASRQQRDTLVEADQKYQQLQQAAAATETLNATIADLKQQINEDDAQLTRLQTQLQEGEQSVQALQADLPDLFQMGEKLNELRIQLSQLDQKLGANQQRVNVLQDQREAKQSLIETRAALTERIERVLRLEKACGRDGVQALLIEHALPQIEEQANEILERLTSGNMRINFQTQKKLKSRKALAETLDITIGDQAGLRPYENFSGGEQFRVNFAIRLALSRILATRSGSRLQTLVIDEGFGSQDPEGQQRLVEAINTIKDDYALILVITHIESLRDAFPNRIEVIKGIAGSTVTVV